jgi:hypothetical protein
MILIAAGFLGGIVSALVGTGENSVAFMVMVLLFRINEKIEKLFYQPMLRDRLGLFGTARIYTLPAWLMNLIYARTRPRGSLVRTLAISSIMATIRMITWAAYQAAVILYRAPAALAYRETMDSTEKTYAV